VRGKQRFLRGGGRTEFLIAIAFADLPWHLTSIPNFQTSKLGPPSVGQRRLHDLTKEHMSTTTIKKDIGFPAYALEWKDDSHVIVSGGGGVGKFGVRNKIVLIHV
jgi:hypothetical protein